LAKISTSKSYSPRRASWLASRAERRYSPQRALQLASRAMQGLLATVSELLATGER